MTIHLFALLSFILFLLCMAPVLVFTVTGYRKHDRYLRQQRRNHNP